LKQKRKKKRINRKDTPKYGGFLMGIIFDRKIKLNRKAVDYLITFGWMFF